MVVMLVGMVSGDVPGDTHERMASDFVCVCTVLTWHYLIGRRDHGVDAAIRAWDLSRAWSILSLVLCRASLLFRD